MTKEGYNLLQAPESASSYFLPHPPHIFPHSNSLLRTSFVFGIADWKVLCARDFFTADRSVCVCVGESPGRNKILKYSLLFAQLMGVKLVGSASGTKVDDRSETKPILRIRL